MSVRIWKGVISHGNTGEGLRFSVILGKTLDLTEYLRKTLGPEYLWKALGAQCDSSKFFCITEIEQKALDHCECVVKAL